MQVLLGHRPTWRGRQEFDPNRRVDENHFRRCCRGLSSRILDRSAAQIPDPKNCGMFWILRTRITSLSAVFTAAEYVFAASTWVAWASSCSSNTRFVRFMCLGYHPVALH